MNSELEYRNQTSKEHRKLFGQYFTPNIAADFMCKWACTGAKNVLDPAVGNSIFLKITRMLNKECLLTGYEIDEKILDFFGNPSHARILNEDYLLSDWNDKYDAIVCNPPYNRFQAVSNRKEIINNIYANTGIKISTYTNLYALFLIKSIYQLEDKGRLAYIIPSEFLNSKYGTVVKKILVENRLLKAVINFENNDELFSDATTTSCILLVDHSAKNKVLFYSLKSINEIELINNINKFSECEEINESEKTDKSDLLGEIKLKSISYDQISSEEKWKGYLHQEEECKYANLVNISQFCHVTRGIATGNNDFFCMSKSKIEKHRIPEDVLTECVCRSRDIKSPFLDRSDYEKLINADRLCYLLDIKENYLLDINENMDSEIVKYIKQGETNGLYKKYILSRRNPWYSMEQKKPAPILVCAANRNGIKFVRNNAGVNTLTAFHSIYVHEKYASFTDIIFCYFLTPLAQRIIMRNSKEMGNGLVKFQPGDLINAKMLDVSVISIKDRNRIQRLYELFKESRDKRYIDKLNIIFEKYLTDY